MRKLTAMLGMALAAVFMLSTVSFAAPKHSKKAAAAPKCSACGMTLSPKKDKMHTVAVKIKGKTWYCCSHCKMDKKGSKKKGAS